MSFSQWKSSQVTRNKEPNYKYNEIASCCILSMLMDGFLFSLVFFTVSVWKFTAYVYVFGFCVVASHFFIFSTNRKSYFSSLCFCTWFISLFFVVFFNLYLVFEWCLRGNIEVEKKKRTQKPKEVVFVWKRKKRTTTRKCLDQN